MEAKVTYCLHIQVTFQSGYTVLLNRQNFEWNRSPFSKQFKNTTTAGKFIATWNRVAVLDQHRKLAVSIASETQDASQSLAGHSTSLSSSQSSTASACVGTTHSLSSADNSLQKDQTIVVNQQV